MVLCFSVWCVSVSVLAGVLKMFNSPIYRYATKMQYARRGEVNVEAVIHVAHEWAKHPLAAGQLHRCIECHRAEGHQHVGHRQ